MTHANFVPVIFVIAGILALIAVFVTSRIWTKRKQIGNLSWTNDDLRRKIMAEVTKFFDLPKDPDESAFAVLADKFRRFGYSTFMSEARRRQKLDIHLGPVQYDTLKQDAVNWLGCHEQIENLKFSQVSQWLAIGVLLFMIAFCIWFLVSG